ncbi:hypothetical protein ACJX0J_026574, partial [Zea mays]
GYTLNFISDAQPLPIYYTRELILEWFCYGKIIKKNKTPFTLESMGTATQFEQATVETTGDHGTEGQGDANFALVCTQDWLRRSTPINIQENIEELTIIEKGIFHHFFLIEEFGNGGKGKRTEATSTS